MPTYDEEPIEPLQHPRDAPLVTDAEVLRRRWRSLMGPEGFGRRSLWLILLDADGVQLPVVMPIDDVPARPDVAMMDGLGAVVKQVLEADSHVHSVAALLSRPGGDLATAADWAWAREVGRAFARAEVPTWPVHLATAGRVQRLTLDQPERYAETG